MREVAKPIGLGAIAALGLVAFDAWCRPGVFAAFEARHWREYVAAFLGSWLLWSSLVVLLRGRFRRVALLALPAAWLGLLIQGGSLVAYGRLTDDESAAFLANQWRFVVGSALGSHDARLIGLSLGFAVFVGGLAWLAGRLGAVSRRAEGLALAVVAGVIGVGAFVNASVLMPLTPDLSALRLAGRLARWGTQPPPFFAVIERQPQVDPQPLPFSVLWIVMETINRDLLVAPDGRAVAPQLLALRDDPAVAWFDRMHSVSSCTDVSVPSILSGVSPLADQATQGRAVLPFDVAHASGALTFVASAQSLTWANQDRYLKRTAFERFDEPSDADDWGVPDELAYGQALDAMRAAHQGRRPFMGLVRSNGTHGPYRVDEADAPWREDPGFGFGDTGGFVRYLNALHRSDREFGRFWEALSKEPWFDQTLILITADHGEAFGQHGLLWHCGTFFPEESHVPGALRLPGVWRAANRARFDALRAQGSALTATIDLLPTLVGILDWTWAPLDGRPLWEAGSRAPIAFTNCSDFRKCVTPSLGFLDDGVRWVLAEDGRRWHRYDERADPSATTDLADGGFPGEIIDRLSTDPRLKGALHRSLEGAR